MHQQIEEPDRGTVRVTDDTSRAELEEAMTHIRASLDRMPQHWTERRAALHAKLDALLVDWERAPDPRLTDADAG